MIDFNITSDGGRIGPLWWINSDRIQRRRYSFGHTRRWGTFGFGRSVRFMLEVD